MSETIVSGLESDANDIEEYKKQFKSFQVKEGEIPPPVCTTFKTELQGCKSDGKSHFISTTWELHPANPIFHKQIKGKANPKYDKRFDHVKYLLDKGVIKPAAPEWTLDGEGKFALMSRKGLFRGKPIFYKDLFYPESKLPTYQDATKWVKEVCKFLLMLNGMKEGAGALENSTMLTTMIQTYVQYWLRDRDLKGAELGALPAYGYEDWGIRNSIWDYIGGIIQRLPVHFIMSTRMGDKWEGGRPTDAVEGKRYKDLPHFFNIILKIWRSEEENRTRFFGKVFASDFTPPGTPFPTMENPSYLKLVAIICKESHAEQLEPFYSEQGTGPNDYYHGDEPEATP